MKMQNRHLIVTGAFAAVVLVSQTHAQFPTPVDITPSLVTPADGADDASISADGRWVAFTSRASDLVAGDTNNEADIFLRDRTNNSIVRVSVATGGGESHPAAIQTTYPDKFVGSPAVSRGGRYVAFGSSAPDLVPNDTNGVTDVFVRDLFLGTTERVSVDSGGVQGNQDSAIKYVQTSGFAGPSVYATASGIAISQDGRYVLFATNATNLGGTSITAQNVYLRDRNTGVTELISVSTGGGGGADASWFPSITANGRYVAFESMAADMIANDTNGVTDVFVRDRTAGTTIRVSEGTGGLEANGASGVAFFHLAICADCGTDTIEQGSQISADGHVVVFGSEATNLANTPAMPFYPPRNVFRHDITTGVTTLVSANPAGDGGNGDSTDPGVSADGRIIVYQTSADDIVVVPQQSGTRILSHDHVLGTTSIVSLDSTGQSAFDSAYAPTVSEDGGGVAFADYADLDPSDTNQNSDVYSVGSTAPSFTDACEGTASTCPCGNVGGPGAGCANSAQPLGARLVANGLQSVSQDSIVLVATRLPANTVVAFAQSLTVAATGSAPAFGDGVRCIQSGTIRLRTVHAVGDTGQLGLPGDPRVSVLGAVPAGGGTRYYQAVYRNVVSFCTPFTFNASNAIRIDWLP